MMLWLLAVLWTSIMKLGVVECVELTFELPDNAKECFHEIIEKDTESTLEFQVILLSDGVSVKWCPIWI